MKATVPFFAHGLGAPELAAVGEVLGQSFLTTGAFVERFEREFAGYLGRRHAIAVTSCTGALHMSLLALGVGPGDEVVTTPMTFMATTTAILEAGATPVFVDVEPTTGNLDVGRVEAAITPRTRAILPVHLYGAMCDMRALRVVASRHGLAVVEDAAHCVEGRRDGVRPGQLADTACFSFYATKNLTCGEGGALVTDDDALARELRLLRLHGMTKTANDRAREGYAPYDMVRLGWKYNMDNIHAAILLPQLARIDATWQRRRELAARYERGLAAIPGVFVPRAPSGSESAHHLFPVWLPRGVRDAALAALQARGVQAMVNYPALHLFSHVRRLLGHAEGSFPVAEDIADRTLSLPFYPTMPDEHVDLVVDALAAALAGAA
jgi:UDP-4-amino-4-deoxy-L-arabinose-oxoglutarate aminotransferase